MATESVYRRLQRHIDNMPVGFPATESGVELRLLQHLFTPEEAALALHLSALPEPLEKIHSRAKKDGISQEALRKGLNRLAAKGAIHKTKIDGKPHYSKLMLAIGMFEFQVNRLTKEFHRDILQYMDEGFAEAALTIKTPQMRTIPISEEVIPERSIGTYDSARELVEGSAGPFGVLNCVCRQGMDLLEEPCRQTDIRETCLVLGEFARAAVRSGAARELQREEMLGLLERADAEGMVLQPQNTQNPEFICCCCGCCCAVLATAKKLPRPAEYFATHYRAVVDVDITYLDGTPSIDDSLCIGCGLCVSTCSGGAIHLVLRAEPKPPPKSQDDLYRKILMERFGILGTAKIAGKKVLGMKI